MCIRDSLHSALRPEGLLVLDILNPNPQYILQANNQLVLDKAIALDDGSIAHKFVAQQADPSQQCMYTTIMYDVLSIAGELRRYSMSCLLYTSPGKRP